MRELGKLWQKIVTDLDEHTADPEIPVFVTGHSLGGAMATIAGMRRKSTQVVTFGEPRVGSNVGAEFRAESHTRYVNGNDPVTMVPPKWWPFCYEHHGDEIPIQDREGPNVVYDHSIVYYAQNLEQVES